MNQNMFKLRHGTIAICGISIPFNICFVNKCKIRSLNYAHQLSVGFCLVYFKYQSSSSSAKVPNTCAGTDCCSTSVTENDKLSIIQEQVLHHDYELPNGRRGKSMARKYTCWQEMVRMLRGFTVVHNFSPDDPWFPLDSMFLLYIIMKQ